MGFHFKHLTIIKDNKNMAIKTKMDKCPKDKRIKLKGKTCQKCEFYSSQRWFTAQGEVDAFCMYEANDIEKNIIKHKKYLKSIPEKPKKPKKPKKKK